MKPVQDTFTSHIQGLYDGHEVAPPQGMKDAVFNQLDSEVSGTSGLTSKAVLAAGVVIVGFAWFLMPETDVMVEPDIAVEQVVVANEAVVADKVVVVDEAVVASSVEVVTAKTEFVEVATAKTESVEVATAKTESVEVEENILLSEDILSEEGATLPVVASPPVETVQKDIEEQKTIDKVEEKKEAVEWVLPAKLKVDE